MIEQFIIARAKLAGALAGFFPLFSLILFVMMMGGPSEPVEPVSSGTVQEAGGPPLLIRLLMIIMISLLVMAFVLIVSKLVALYGIRARWYYAWIFHLIEMNFILFLEGLLLVVAVLSFKLAFVSLFKLIAMFTLLYILIGLKKAWGDRSISDLYQVTHYTHA